MSDLAAGLYLAVGILVALHDRERTGTGRWVQTSLLESMIAMMDFQAARWTIDQRGRRARRATTTRRASRWAASRRLTGTSTSRAAGGRLLHNLCQAIGLPGLPDDPRFDTAGQRARLTGTS